MRADVVVDYGACAPYLGPVTQDDNSLVTC